MAIFQDWAKKTGDWEEVASEALDFYFLNDVKVTGYAGPFLLDFSLSQKNVFYTATVCINDKHQV